MSTIFDTKIALVIREDLMIWQKLNVSAFLTSAVIAHKPELIGEVYRDASDVEYLPMLIQPVLIYAVSAEQMTTVYSRLRSRDCRFAVFTEELFTTGNDADNRAAVKRVPSQQLTLVGLGLREERRTADKILKGLKLHA